MHVERTFTVSRPVEEVYDYLVDFSRTEEWDPGTVSTTRTSGSGGVGTTYANVSAFMGRQVELTYTTAVANRPGRLEFHGRNKASSTKDILTLRSTGPGTTEVHYRAEFRFHGVTKVLAPLVIDDALLSAGLDILETKIREAMADDYAVAAE